jgi:serine/threonine protein kinase
VPIRCPHCRAPFDPIEPVTAEARNGGAAIGRFELVALLERTPFGITRYRARDPYLDRPVRLTLGPGVVRGAPLDRLLRAGPPSGDFALDRFLHEARLLARLNHPAIPAVYEVGIVDDLPYMAGRHVEGRTLAEREHDGSSPAQRVPDSSPRWPTPCSTSTNTGSSTATSGRARSWSTSTAGPI